jgi:hypothetical protein
LNQTSKEDQKPEHNNNPNSKRKISIQTNKNPSIISTSQKKNDVSMSVISVSRIDNNSENQSEKSISSSTSSIFNRNQQMSENSMDSSSKSNIIIKEKEKPTSKNDDKKFLKDQKDNEDNQNTEKLIIDISNNLKDCKGLLEKEMEEIRKHKDFFDSKNFILTDLSCKRMAEIIHYIKTGNPVLLEGDTGTAKTRTSVIACEYLMEYSNEILKEEEEKDKNKKKN